MTANNKSKGIVNIVGDTTKIGTTLLIGGVSINDKDGLGDLHYQWLSNDNPIEQETGNRYTLTKNDIGKVLNVKVSYIDGKNNAETVKSTNTKKVEAPVNNKSTGTIAIKGDATKIGTELSIINTIKDKDGLGEFNYQWLRDGKAINSAISDKYTLSQDDKGKTINLQINYTDGAGYNETVKSTNTKKVDAGKTTTTPIKVDLSGPTSVNEGSSVTYTATLTKALTTTTSIPYTLSGTGISTNDFTGLSILMGNLIIPEGSTTGAFTLNIINDLKTEEAETLIVKLDSMAASDVTLGTKSSISTTIFDTPTVATTQNVTFTSNATKVNEGNAVTYKATLLSVTPTDLSIPYTLSGTGIEVSDFVGRVSLTGNIVISAGTTTGTFILNVANDAKTEGQENVTVTLGAAAGVTIGMNAESQFTTIVDTSTTANNSNVLTPIFFENAITFSFSNIPEGFKNIDSQIDWLNGANAVNLSSEYKNNTFLSTNLRADFNGDGIKDIVVADFDSCRILLDLSIEPGLNIFTNFNLGGNPYFVGSGDFNNDGKLDIVTYNAGKTMSVLFNKGVDISISTPVTIDHFVSGTKLIDLSKVDAKSGTSVDDAFILLPISDTVPKFTAEGQLRFNPASNTLEGHTTGLFDTVNFSIVLTGVTSVKATDFIL